MQTTKLQKRLFGTNGVRGVVGKDLTPELSTNYRRSTRNNAERMHRSWKRHADLR